MTTPFNTPQHPSTPTTTLNTLNPTSALTMNHTAIGAGVGFGLLTMVTAWYVSGGTIPELRKILDNPVTTPDEKNKARSSLLALRNKKVAEKRKKLEEIKSEELPIFFSCFIIILVIAIFLFWITGSTGSTSLGMGVLVSFLSCLAWYNFMPSQACTDAYNALTDACSPGKDGGLILFDPETGEFVLKN